jgi:hypothetical protein
MTVKTSPYNSVYNVNVGVHGFIGYRFTQTFEINIEAEYITSSLVAYNKNWNGNTSSIDTNSVGFSIEKYSVGLVCDKIIPINYKLGYVISGGLMYNHISILEAGELYGKKSLGFKLEGGLNLYTSKLLTLQGLIGGEYADAKDKGIDMNYSGLIFVINIILNK